jgi:hypothetical protein
MHGIAVQDQPQQQRLDVPPRLTRRRRRFAWGIAVTFCLAALVVAVAWYALIQTAVQPALRPGPPNAGGAEYNVTLLATAPAGSEIIVNAENPCSGNLPSGSYHYWTCIWALSWGCPQGCTGKLSALNVTSATLTGDVGDGPGQLYQTHVWTPSEVPPDGKGQSIIAVSGEAQLGDPTAPTLYWWANLTVTIEG